MDCIDVILSLDYEIFGDASGNPLELQVNTTRRLVDTLSEINARMTLFVEYGYIDFLRRYRAEQAIFAAYLESIEIQLQSLCRDGHDIQLHFHPTWEGARLNSSGRIDLNLNNDDITNLPYDCAAQWLGNGKRYLESLLIKVQPDYRCLAFRAGAFTATNESAYSRLLSDSGIVIDSSVVPGGRLSSGYGNFDYSQVQRTCPYRFDESLRLPDPTGEKIEYPILTESKLLATLKYNNAHGAKNRSLMRRAYPEKLTDRGSFRALSIFKKLTRGYAIADFNFLGAKELCKMILHASHAGSICPPVVMLLGHSKFSYFNDELLLLNNHLLDAGIKPNYSTLSAHYFRYFAQRHANIHPQNT